ncbi:3-deoxy-7-phosphoheptulonate synthase [Streptomyces sp. NPDC091377]|uniref:3-deoxy-7-phosphoheptulonate synthase n=1 Tax=Streptomyces sp. NPDC091377 TaxID=3365995 RepID=UPI003801C03F
MNRPDPVLDALAHDVAHRPADQQPDWPDPDLVRRVRAALATRPALVRPTELRALEGLLARAAAGEILVVQSGDCAEDPADRTPADVGRKAAVLDLLAGALRTLTGTPVERVGRIAGQYAKPRSQPYEQTAGGRLPVYRGHLVNAPDPDPDARRPDPLRLLLGYLAAGDVMEHLGRPGRDLRRSGPTRPEPGSALWTSHEALVLDYEIPLLRRDEDGRPYLGSTHWPWLGVRTARLDGAHVALLAVVSNPVSCKVGPAMTPAALVALCARLDPRRRPGRLTLVARMGADRVADRLPPLVAAVRAAGHPVVWLCDPMHGNTVTAPDGRKVRAVATLCREVVLFQRAVTAGGGIAGGLHLETTPDDVTECTAQDPGPGDTHRASGPYTSLCDPRLNPDQALTVVSAWRDTAAPADHPPRTSTGDAPQRDPRRGPGADPDPDPLRARLGDPPPPPATRQNGRPAAHHEQGTLS